MPTSFPIVPRESALLFFDTLNIYFHPKDPDARARVEASNIIPTFEKLNAACRAVGMPVFYAQADHRPDGKDFAPLVVDLGYEGQRGEGPRLTTPPHAVAGTWEAEIIPEIGPQPGDYIIRKHRWSTFFQTHFALSLRTAGIRTIVVAGGSTEVGIASTAYSARDRDLNLILIRDACVSQRPGVNEMFMDQVFPIFARVMTADELLKALGTASPSKP